MPLSDPRPPAGPNLVVLADEEFDPQTLANQNGDVPDDLCLVQLVRAPTVAELDGLRRQWGLQLTRYVPNLAYIEAVPRANRGTLAGDPLVRTVAPLLATHRLAPELTHGPSLPAIATKLRRCVALVFDNADVNAAKVRISAVTNTSDVVELDDRAVGGTTRIMFKATSAVDLRFATDPQALRDIQWIELRDIAPGSATPITTRHGGTNEQASAIHQSGVIGRTPIWNQGLEGDGQIVSVIDAGIGNYQIHPLLVDGSRSPGPSHRKIHGVAADAPVNDGHALAVAGFLAGKSTTHTDGDFHTNRGGAPSARLVLSQARDFRASGEQEAIGLTAFKRLLEIRMAGATIHNNSWVDSRFKPGYSVLSYDYDLFTHVFEQHLVVAALLNSINAEVSAAPHLTKNAVAVAATQSPANPMAYGSGKDGPTFDGRRKPDLVAIGGGFKKAIITNKSDDDPTPTAAMGDVDFSQCSYAAPGVAAAAALIRQYFTEGFYSWGLRRQWKGTTPSGALLKAMLVASARPIATTPDDHTGWGLIQLDRVLYFTGGVTGVASQASRLLVRDVPHRSGLTTGTHRDLTVTVATRAPAATLPLRIVLAYSDRPGTPGAGDTVVNNLNLRVTDPAGNVYAGNHFGPNGHSVVGGAADNRNNVEVVAIPQAAPGPWTIRVEGTAVNVASALPGSTPATMVTKPSKQGYALVVVGDVVVPWCFVATTVYGDPHHPDVEAIRDWRDRNLHRRWMRTFAALYHRAGPAAARMVVRVPPLRRLLRHHVLPRLAARFDRDRAGQDRGAGSETGTPA